MTRLIANIDGGARGNPGPAAAAFVIKSAENGKVLSRAGIYLGKATNNQAEYRGLIAALAQAVKLGADELEVVSDSELMVRQMTGHYRVKNSGLLPLFQEAVRLSGAFKKFSIRHATREHNKAADRLVNLAIDSQADVSPKDD